MYFWCSRFDMHKKKNKIVVKSESHDEFNKVS